MKTAPLTDDLTRPVVPRSDRKGLRPEDRCCEVCGIGRLYLVRQTFGVLAGYRLCVECGAKYDAARAAGRVP